MVPNGILDFLGDILPFVAGVTPRSCVALTAPRVPHFDESHSVDGFSDTNRSVGMALRETIFVLLSMTAACCGRLNDLMIGVVSLEQRPESFDVSHLFSW